MIAPFRYTQQGSNIKLHLLTSTHMMITSTHHNQRHGARVTPPANTHRISPLLALPCSAGYFRASPAMHWGSTVRMSMCGLLQQKKSTHKEIHFCRTRCKLCCDQRSRDRPFQRASTRGREVRKEVGRSWQY